MPKFLLTIISLSLCLVLIAHTAQAALIPCGRSPESADSPEETVECNICHFFLLAQRIFNLLLLFLSALTLLVGIIVGYMFFAGSFSPEMITTARKALTSMLIGFFIVIIGWVLIFSVGKAMGWSEQRGGKWWQIYCAADIAIPGPGTVPGTPSDPECEFPANITNFRIEEFNCCPSLYLTPVPYQYCDNVIRLAQNLQVLRNTVNKAVIITSGYRTPENNTEVGGSPQSLHLTASAADINVPGYSSAELFCVIKHLIQNNQMAPGGLGVYEGHVHYDLRANYDQWKGDNYTGPDPSCY